MSQQRKGVLNWLQEYSIPLIAGVLAALAWANLDHHSYHAALHWVPGFLHDVHLFHHGVPYFLVNDVFMVFFFGIAAKEITEATLPGGSLNPIKKAINPLFATIGGVAGPVLFFFMALSVFHGQGAFPDEMNLETLRKAWAIPTATDIALAWLVARAVFGPGHPAINFLLLLAVADDAIGLAIIAIFYGDPLNPAAPQWLLLNLLGMVVAFVMRKRNVQSWIPYIAISGPLCWAGLILAHLHPALALVFVVPFLPGPRRDTGLFAKHDEVDRMGPDVAHDLGIDHSPLHLFEHQLKFSVDFGLFFFGLANAGVVFADIGGMTWIVLGSLVIGKTIGITALTYLAKLLGFPVPERMGLKEVAMAGLIAALGLTVALFVAGAAFPGESPEIASLRGQAKMGALFSGFVGIVAIGIGRMLGINRSKD